MKEIELTKGYKTKVDDSDFGWLILRRWCFSNGYAKGTWDGKRLYMHQLLVGIEEGKMTDHIDGDKLNNQRANLRLVTHAQNERNKGRKDYGTEVQYKGIYRKFNKWVARIWVNGKKIHLGYFFTDWEAARAYDKAAIEYFGNDIRRNFYD